VKQAREAGADDTAIQAAIQVGLKVRKGSADRFDKQTAGVLDG
jgi:hypothetical protein